MCLPAVSKTSFGPGNLYFVSEGKALQLLRTGFADLNSALTPNQQIAAGGFSSFSLTPELNETIVVIVHNP